MDGAFHLVVEMDGDVRVTIVAGSRTRNVQIVHPPDVLPLLGRLAAKPLDELVAELPRFGGQSECRPQLTCCENDLTARLLSGTVMSDLPVYEPSFVHRPRAQSDAYLGRTPGDDE